MNKILNSLKNVDYGKFNILWELIYSIILVVPFAIMDLVIRQLSRQIHYNTALYLPSVLFSLLWMMLLVFVPLNLKRIVGRIVYAICFGLFFVLFLVNCIYFSYTGFFFHFSLLELAGEGSAYIISTLMSIHPLIYAVALFILLIGICIIIKFPKREKNRPFVVSGVVILFVILHLWLPSVYGDTSTNLEWDTWSDPREVYENFNDCNKSLKVCGFYEYIFRDFHKTLFKEKTVEDPEEIAFLETEFAKTTTHEENEYTGIFEGKNIIFLQLEGMDTWLFNEEDMPNLYGLLKNSLNFENHYSYYTGGGSTFNSEFALNTGFVTPMSYVKNAYTFSSNGFNYSMSNTFKELGYNVNAFHMNTGEYYSRRLNYENWGYDGYYGLKDIMEYHNDIYELDRQLILNDIFYEKMFCQDGPFVNYLITYTIHTGYSAKNGKGLLLASEKYGENIPELTREECARMYASETDHMVGLLLEALEENGLLEDTVIVAYADHYLFTFGDKTVLGKYKETDDNLINHTPFFIWSYGMEAETVEKVNSQLDILPTVLNLFGIEYMDEYYIGTDIMDEKYSGYVFFNDYSWYDGNAYVENGEVTNGAEVDKDYVTQMNNHINQLVQRNDLVLKYDYFSYLE